MTAMIDRPKLRALAEAALEASEPVPGAEGDPLSLLSFNAKANPRTVLALLDELDQSARVDAFAYLNSKLEEAEQERDEFRRRFKESDQDRTRIGTALRAANRDARKCKEENELLAARVAVVEEFRREALEKRRIWESGTESNPSANAKDAAEWVYAAGQILQRMDAIK